MASRTISEHAYSRALESMSAFQNSYQDLRSDYVAAKESRFLQTPVGIHQAGSAADYHYRNERDYYYMVEAGRHIARNDSVVAQGIRTFVRNVIQEGFRLKPRTGDANLDDQLADRWMTYTGSEQQVDVGGEFDFHAMEKCCAGAIVTDGDITFSPLRSGQLQPFEAHRMRSPSKSRHAKRQRNIVLGVERNKVGRRLRYWITRKDFDGITQHKTFGARDLVPYDAYQFDAVTNQQERNFFHVYHPKRYSQTRGVSPLVPVMVTAGMHDDCQYAKLVQQQLASYFALIHNYDADVDVVARPSAGDGSTQTEDRYCGSDRFETMHATVHHPGAEYFGQPGETLTGFSPAIPNAEFFQQSRMLLTFIAVNLDLPLILFLMDASETNFSGWRGAFDQAKIRFRDFQCELASRFHARIYRWKLRQWLAQDAELQQAYTIIGPDIFRHDWHYPRWPYIEPQKDVMADYTELKTTQNSPRRVLLRKGLEWKEIVDESVEDRGYGIEKAIAEAKRLNTMAEDADRVSWRELVSFDLPIGVQMAFPIQGENEESKVGRPSNQPE